METATFPYIGAHSEYLARIYNLGLKLEIHFPLSLGVALFETINNPVILPFNQQFLFVYMVYISAV